MTVSFFFLKSIKYTKLDYSSHVSSYYTHQAKEMMGVWEVLADRFLADYDNCKAYRKETERQPVLHMHSYYVQKMREYNTMIKLENAKAEALCS